MNGIFNAICINYANRHIIAGIPGLEQSLFDGLSLTNVVVNGDTLTIRRNKEDQKIRRSE
ncbi:MAG TPA: hypothetical protein P5086_14170 [Prolixibacteraceae bacterium]|nr:hypothetical protein [Bacteroidales bacterium]HPJ79927.1 hypothetical protein [Prolixibacteraceae bacterium]HRV90452.1 hypothetical protein [Prolixibacteraceae bacterium]